MQTPSQIFTDSLIKLMRPVIRISLRYGFAYNSFSELVKRMYVEVASEELAREGRKQTIARISILTGINKKITKRIMELPAIETTGVDDSFNRSVRVISGWLRDKDFRDKKGDPESLPFDGEAISFTELVKRYSGDMSAKPLAEELLRINAVEFDRHGDLRLTSRGYVPGGGEVDKLKLLGSDVSDLIQTIDHNIQNTGNARRFQRKVAYINFPTEHLPKFRELNAELSQNMLEQLNKWLAGHESEKTDESVCRIGVGIYQFEEH
jgi:hypothetical protein